MWYEYLKSFFIQYDYPIEGADFLLALTADLCGGSELWNTLLDGVRAYETGALQKPEDLSALLAQIKDASIQAKIPSESAELLLFLLCTKHLKSIYDHMNLPESYFKGVAIDIRCKLRECHAVRGIWGTFVAIWFAGFFAMTRFAIGRLQYEMIKMPPYISTDGTYCFDGQPAVNLHIPSSGPLVIEEVRASMSEAARFFGKYFPQGKVLFHCNSWLLFPGHYEMLPPTSGIRQFMDEFTLIRGDTHADRHDLWRLFNTEDVADPSRLPQNTSLQRKYVQWIAAGKPVGSAIGIRYYSIR